jgi:ElaB/YqjD/DUF883 family membrane-anchored ribosome-binding protein
MPRNPELPEGTDHIVNGALDTRSGKTGAKSGGGASPGFVGSSAGDDTGGVAGTGGGSGSDGSGRGVSSADIKAQLRDGANNMREQASGKAREYAEQGKSRATTALDDLSKVVNEAAGSIDERMGPEYGRYARQAADAVSGFADTLRNKQVDELYDNARELVRKSPAVAIGAAAVVGFTLVRLIKSGTDSRDEVDVEFTPDTTNPTLKGSTSAGRGD